MIDISGGYALESCVLRKQPGEGRALSGDQQTRTAVQQEIANRGESKNGYTKNQKAVERRELMGWVRSTGENLKLEHGRINQSFTAFSLG